MARILRGDVYWAELDPVKGREQAGRRPVLVLSHEVFNDRSGTVIATAVTGEPQRAAFPLTVEVASARLPKPSWVRVSQIRTLSIEGLTKRIGHVLPEELQRVVDGLNEIIAT